ncbi:uncharacterized protein MAM_04660 [Metarhizium album ARSEF 1941]|uniref:Uncharacterized protein n=1 Tax=Metarhizium album (strain ARSEF 1941) TaxID=1081103 RepID=A0A0B2WXQ3_METAS|nr:uncharacterized protein MAM_04660 [Metarhizium album ARSEF 1941]KHN97645.1 hypothetical protein MAM_04660 [Metarhizium album ARSEF 1941]
MRPFVWPKCQNPSQLIGYAGFARACRVNVGFNSAGSGERVWTAAPTEEYHDSQPVHVMRELATPLAPLMILLACFEEPIDFVGKFGLRMEDQMNRRQVLRKETSLRPGNAQGWGRLNLFSVSELAYGEGRHSSCIKGSLKSAFWIAHWTVTTSRFRAWFASVSRFDMVLAVEKLVSTHVKVFRPHFGLRHVANAIFYY